MGILTILLKHLFLIHFIDSYRGVVVFVRIKEGSIKVGNTIKFMATGATYEVTELGVRTPAEVKKR